VLLGKVVKVLEHEPCPGEVDQHARRCRQSWRGSRPVGKAAKVNRASGGRARGSQGCAGAAAKGCVAGA
jgi:hypothetical protein